MTFLVSATSPIAGKFVVKKFAGWGILGADIPTTGDNGGSPVLNDGINSAKEYHWRVETPPSAGVLTIYPDLTFEWDGSGVPDGSYPWVYRLFEDGVSAGTATVSQASGALSLVISRAAHGHMADSLTLSATGIASLAVQDALHGHQAGAPSLTAQWLLAVADSLHAHAADNVALATVGSASLAIAESAHAHIADSATLSTRWLLAIADALHAQSADNATLGTSNAVLLALQDATHGHVAEGVVLTMSNWLAIADSLHGHHADSLQIDPGQRSLVIAEARHLHFADQLLLSLPGSGLTADARFIITLGARLLSVFGDSRNPLRAAEPMIIYKDPSEKITVTFNFPSQVTAVLNPVVTCTVIGSQDDPDAAAMVHGALQIEGTKVLQLIVGGLARSVYKLRCDVDDADGEHWVATAKLKVIKA